jgi:hypothetical protein
LKKLIALILLTIHLLNIGGQLAFHQYLVYRSDKFFDKQINEHHYSVDDLTEIRVPVNMHGITDWKNYENLYGQVRFGHTAYNYVKIRMTRNAIYLVCIPNYETTHLSDQNIIDARQIPDIPVSKKDHVPFGKINLTVYNYQTICYKFSIPIIFVRKTICDNHLIVLNPLIAGPGQPPDRITTIS